MADFLLELFSEEIPARMQAAAATQLHDRFTELLSEGGLQGATIETHVTPRRLALIARGLPDASAASTEERRGPRADAPAKAIDGFLKSTGLSLDQLETRDDPKGRFYYAVIRHEGEPTATILARRLPALIGGFQWPKSQRWGKASIFTASPRWVRPLRAIVALLGDAVVPFEALGLDSGRETFGHRFMGPPGTLCIDSVESYSRQLAEAYVVLSAGERRTLIADGAVQAAGKVGVKLRADAGLVAENAGLTEWPVPLAGHFDEAFLTVPPEIIQLTMATNQKYFACEDAAGKLAPYFVCVANLQSADGGAAIVAGNERVLSARLADARFFWEQDRKTPLEQQLPKLADRLFFEGLGTLHDKAGRIGELAAWLAGRLFPALPPERARLAGRMLKADLVTQTINEFPEVQGIIGGHLARNEGLGDDIATALSEQYSGRPTTPLSIVVSLADRADTLAAFFARGLKPTGSKDPFALRRAGLQLIQIILDNGLRLPLLPLFTKAGEADPAELLAFLIDRLKVQQREAGIRHDLIDAVVAGGADDDLVRLVARVRALQAFVESADGANLLAGTRRASNIVRIEEKKDGRIFAPDVASRHLVAPAEVALDRALTLASADVSSRVATEDFVGAMEQLAALRPLVDAFFDDVTVNDADAALRANRLSLLAKLRQTAAAVADFSLIEG